MIHICTTDSLAAVYSNGGQSYTRGKRHRSQLARANRRKARRIK